MLTVIYMVLAVAQIVHVMILKMMEKSVCHVNKRKGTTMRVLNEYESEVEDPISTEKAN